MTRKYTVIVSAFFVFLCFNNAAIAGGSEDSMRYFIKSDRISLPDDGKQEDEKKEDNRAEGKRISLNLKGSKFGDVLRALAQLYTLNYSISSTSPGASGTLTAGSLPSLQPQPSIQSAMHGSGQQAGQNINDITVNFAYKGDSVDEAVGLLCKGADVFCKKEKELWVISRYEVYIIDKDIFFTYSVSNGGGATGTTASSGLSQPVSGSATATAVQSSLTTTAAGAAGSTSSGTDSIGISGNFDDFVQFIKTFLTKDGSVQISKSGYVVVVDVPSAIAKVRKIMEKDMEMNERVTLKVDVIQVDLNDNYSAGVNWNAVMKNVTVNGSFAPANAFSIGYNTTMAGNAVSTLLSALGDYGKSKVVKSWETAADNGIPIFFNVTENIPYFTQSQAITTGVAQTSTAVNYVNVGLKIKILPNIRHDMLNGGIYAEISELEEMDSSGGSNPTTAPQTSLTNTAVPLDVKWGGSFVLTGFKTSQNSTTAQGVPWLSKIPLVGALFGYQAKNALSSELAIVVTATKTGSQEVVKDAE